MMAGGSDISTKENISRAPSLVLIRTSEKKITPRVYDALNERLIENDT